MEQFNTNIYTTGGHNKRRRVRNGRVKTAAGSLKARQQSAKGRRRVATARCRPEGRSPVIPGRLGGGPKDRRRVLWDHGRSNQDRWGFRIPARFQDGVSGGREVAGCSLGSLTGRAKVLTGSVMVDGSRKVAVGYAGIRNGRRAGHYGPYRGRARNAKRALRRYNPGYNSRAVPALRSRSSSSEVTVRTWYPSRETASSMRLTSGGGCSRGR